MHTAKNTFVTNNLLQQVPLWTVEWGGVQQSSVKCSVKNENQSVEWGVQGVECESETAQCNVQNVKFGVWSVQCVDCRMRGVEWTLQKAAWEAKVWRVEYGVWSSKWGVCVDS